MKSRKSNQPKSKNFRFFLLSIAILLLLFIIYFFHSSSFQNRVIIKLNWGIWIPSGNELYTYSDLKDWYAIYQYSPSENRIIKKLNKNILSKERQDKITNHISTLAIPDEYFPAYDTIDFLQVKDAGNGSILYLLYSSKDLKLYIISSIN